VDPVAGIRATGLVGGLPTAAPTEYAPTSSGSLWSWRWLGGTTTSHRWSSPSLI